MRTTKGIPWRMGLYGVVAGAVLLWAAGVRAQTEMTSTCTDASNCKIGTDRAASILVWPKVVVDTSNGADTVIQLTNASDRRTVDVQCFYVNGIGHCAGSDTSCTSDFQCGIGGQCIRWEKRDFQLTLTKRQPVSWKASEGAQFLPCDSASPDQQSCITDSNGVQIYNSGSIPQVATDPFYGELKCVQVDDTGAPVDFNSLKGEATTIRTGGNPGGLVDVSKYNAIGIQGIPGRQDYNNDLCIGGDNPTATCPNGAEYAGCPQTLIADSFFDGATVPGTPGPITSDLTLVPCAEDFEQASNTTGTVSTVQFLVFNEFEQRFSTSYRISCWDERPLSDIDTRSGPADDGASIFNVAVEGTLTGQTRIRAVGTDTEARGFLGLLEEFHACSNGPGGECTATVNLHQQGTRSLSDILKIGP